MLRAMACRPSRTGSRRKDSRHGAGTLQAPRKVSEGHICLGGGMGKYLRGAFPFLARNGYSEFCGGARERMPGERRDPRLAFLSSVDSCQGSVIVDRNTRR